MTFSRSGTPTGIIFDLTSTALLDVPTIKLSTLADTATGALTLKLNSNANLDTGTTVWFDIFSDQAGDFRMNLNFTGNQLVTAINFDGVVENTPGAVFDSSHPTYGAYFTGSGSLQIIPIPEPASLVLLGLGGLLVLPTSRWRRHGAV